MGCKSNPSCSAGLALGSAASWAEGGHGDQSGHPARVGPGARPPDRTRLPKRDGLGTLAIIAVSMWVGECAYIPLADMSWIGALLAPFLIAPLTIAAFAILSRPRFQLLLDFAVLGSMVLIGTGSERDPSPSTITIFSCRPS